MFTLVIFFSLVCVLSDKQIHFCFFKFFWSLLFGNPYPRSWGPIPPISYHICLSYCTFIPTFNPLLEFTRASKVMLIVKNLPANAEDIRDRFNPWVGKIPWRRIWQPPPVFLPGESHGQRSLAGCTVHRVAKSETQLKQFSTQTTNRISKHGISVLVSSQAIVPFLLTC